jgi:hypothetical protein
MTTPPLTAPVVSALRTEPGPVDPVRVKTFARFFKNYMSISAVVAAALPIPVTSFKLIPTFAAHTPLLSTYTSLFCFLLLAFIFYSRHALGRAMFPQQTYASARVRAACVGIAPAVLIAASLVCVFYYHGSFSASVSKLSANANDAAAPLTEVLEKIPLWGIPSGEVLILWYLGIFVFAEAAFILMALREYLQDLLKIEEMDLIYPPIATDDRDKSELFRALSEYRRQLGKDNGSYADFLEWAATMHLDQLVRIVSKNSTWQQEIRDRLATEGLKRSDR